MSEHESHREGGLEGRDGAPLGLPVISGWCVRAGSEGADVGRAWAQRAGAVACWPSGRVTLERRFVKARGSVPVREFVLAATAGQETLGGPEAAKTELERLVAPLCSAQLMAAVDEAGDLSPWKVGGISDVAELPELSDLAPEGLGGLGAYLDEIIDVLGSEDGGSILSLIMATPGDLDGVAETLWAPPSGESAVAMRTPFVLPQRRPVRLRLRLAGTHSLPASVLALAGALALGPTQSAGRGWRRAAGPAEQETARRAVNTLATDAWWSNDPILDEGCASTVAAATLMSLPARTEVLDRLPVAMVPVGSPEEQGAPIGRVANRSGGLVPQRLPWAKRVEHTYVCGASGSGKSSLLGQALSNDLAEGRGIVVLDPHGPLAEQTLGLVPEHRLDDVVSIDPLDPEGPAVDLIPPGEVEDPERTASRLSDALEELHDPGGRHGFCGPRFTQAIQMAVVALLDVDPVPDARATTVLDVERLLVNSDFRRDAISRTRDQTVREFWEQWDAHSRTAYHQSEMLPWITSKLAPLTHGPLKGALGDAARYRFEEALRQHAIVVCRIPVGELGFRASNFLGRMILARVLDALAAGARAKGETPEVSVVVDEAQTLADGQSLERFFSQARKWGAATAISSQTPSALGPDTLQSVLTNTANVFLFRLPPSQAGYFTEQLSGHAERVAKLPDYYAVGRIGGSGEPFVMQGLPPVESDPAVADEARRRSRERWGRIPTGQAPDPEPDAGSDTDTSTRTASSPADRSDLPDEGPSGDPPTREAGTGRTTTLLSHRLHVWVRRRGGLVRFGIARACRG